ncbi:hypothetical protein AURDEDRAFT_154928 [Auricularia subglabra TFB-10046 SS5]|uniref:Uncharacterized protein n=1 Tax=Auricularia subglabra (strain TFB-10046 / SS5) TaxID=717982 RepID=J0D7V4_AURST|nr:hypothetical protein AURDEDRAFT_154928 [Auricularia subglabra TFB-10046 SS5]
MVVTRRNHRTLKALARDDASSHVFNAVRRLVSDQWLDTWAPDLLRRLLAGVTSIDAPLALVEILSESPIFRPSVLAVRYCRLATFVDDLPAATLASVTHLTGYFPGGNDAARALTEDRVAHMLARLPALSHVAFDVLDLNTVDSDGDDEDDGITPGLLELDALERALRATLQHARIAVVALRVGGDWMHHGPAVLDIARKLRDPRLRVWHDERPMTSWVREENYAAADAWAGRSIWTEAKQVWPPSP